MCKHENCNLSRRGHKTMEPEGEGDEFSSHFKTSMLFTKSMKSL